MHTTDGRDQSSAERSVDEVLLAFEVIFPKGSPTELPAGDRRGRRLAPHLAVGSNDDNLRPLSSERTTVLPKGMTGSHNRSPRKPAMGHHQASANTLVSAHALTQLDAISSQPTPKRGSTNGHPASGRCGPKPRSSVGNGSCPSLHRQRRRELRRQSWSSGCSYRGRRGTRGPAPRRQPPGR
jgi:hypothetical protein